MAWQVVVSVTSVRGDFTPDGDDAYETEADARMRAAVIVERGTWVGGAEPDKFMGPHRVTYARVVEV